MKIKIKYVLWVAVICMLAGIICGTLYNDRPVYTPENNLCDTAFIYDTVYKEIPNDIYHYSQVIDTVYSIEYVEIPQDVDTLAILKDYYSTYDYYRTWEDTTISVNFTDRISQNKIVESTLLNYKLLQPQTTISQVTNVNKYAHYLGIGLNTDLKLLAPNFQLTYVTPKLNYNILYYPRQESVGLGITYNFLNF